MEESEYQLLITHTLNQRKLKWWWRHTVKILNLQMKPEKNVEKRWILREKRILLNLKSRCGVKFSRFNLVKIFRTYLNKFAPIVFRTGLKQLTVRIRTLPPLKTPTGNSWDTTAVKTDEWQRDARFHQLPPPKYIYSSSDTTEEELSKISSNNFTENESHFKNKNNWV